MQLHFITFGKPVHSPSQGLPTYEPTRNWVSLGIACAGEQPAQISVLTLSYTRSSKTRGVVIAAGQLYTAEGKGPVRSGWVDDKPEYTAGTVENTDD